MLQAIAVHVQARVPAAHAPSVYFIYVGKNWAASTHAIHRKLACLQQIPANSMLQAHAVRVQARVPAAHARGVYFICVGE